LICRHERRHAAMPEHISPPPLKPFLRRAPADTPRHICCLLRFFSRCLRQAAASAADAAAAICAEARLIFQPALPLCRRADAVSLFFMISFCCFSSATPPPSPIEAARY